MIGPKDFLKTQQKKEVSAFWVIAQIEFFRGLSYKGYK